MILANEKRILAVSLSTRGFGYTVMEGETLVDWGVKSIKGGNCAAHIKKAGELIKTFEPDVLVMHDTNAKGSKRGERATRLTQELSTLAKSHTITVCLLSRQQVHDAFLGDNEGTKHTIATIIAERYPEELGARLPSERRPWDSEGYSMGIFDAVSLALAY